MEIDPNPKTPVNIGNPEEYTINDLARLVSCLTRSSSPIIHQPLPLDDPRLRRPDISLARKLLGWSPRTTVRRGMAKTIEWFAGTTINIDDGSAHKRPAGGMSLPSAAAVKEAS